MKDNQEIKKALSELDSDERSALLFGFPMPPTDSFDGLSDDEYDADSRMEVNGDWKPMKVSDDLSFVDDEFDNFLTKKARKRNKARRKKRKELRSQGVSRKDARRQARKEALKEIPRDKLKDIAKRSFKNIGKGIKKGALALPRGSYLALLRVNYRGNAWKIMAIHNGTNANLKKKLKNKWEKLGGNYSKLIKNASIGARKKPFFCGAKCKRGLLNKGLKKSFDGNFELDDLAFYNALDPVTISAIVGSATAVISALGGILANAQASKQQEKQIQAEKETQQKSLDAMSESEKRQIALAEKQLKAQADPIQQILNNPNLTQAEKDKAIALTKDALKDERGANLKKWLLIGGIGVVALGVIAYMVKRNK
jgi:hypothetical protein